MRKTVIGAAFGLAIIATACQRHLTTSSAPRDAASGANVVDCNGDSYLDVNNPSRASLEVYAYIGTTSGTYVGTASPGFTHLSLAGTPLDHKNGSLYAMQNGQIVTNAGVPSSTVTITRRCDRRG